MFLPQGPFPGQGAADGEVVDWMGKLTDFDITLNLVC